MSTTQQDRPGGKSRQRNRKGPKPDRKNEDQTGAPAGSTAAVANGAAAPVELAAGEASAPVDASPIGAAAPADAASVHPPVPAEHRPIGMHMIANAYGNYTTKLFQQTGSFVARLMVVRSFDAAIEVQVEFARSTFADLIEESQNICDLHSGLARQAFQSWQGFATGVRSDRDVTPRRYA